MRRFSWLGIGMIAIGTAMLLDRTHVLRFEWITVVWCVIGLFGLLRAIDGFGKKAKGRVFWGTFLFLFGMYATLRNLDIVELRTYWWPSAMLLVVGFALFVVVASSPKDWHLLIPALLLTGMGTVIILADLGYIYRYDVVEAVRLYWPVGLILFGLALVLKHSLSRSTQH